MKPIYIPEGLTAVAVAKDRAQAERWSFALLALEIPHELTEAGQAGRPVLLVRVADEARARETIREVDLEDEEHRSREAASQPVPRLPERAILLAELMVVGLMAMSMAAGFASGGGGWFTRGRMVASLVFKGEPERLFTALTLHGDDLHLAGNMLFLLVIAPTIIFRLGFGVTILAWVVSGAAGNLATALYHGGGFSNVGASGGIFGLTATLGLLSARGGDFRRRSNRWLLGTGAAMGLLSMLAFGPKADVVAHLGGFVAGAPFGLLFPLRDRRSSRSRWVVGQVAAAAVGIGLLAGAWGLAWR